MTSQMYWLKGGMMNIESTFLHFDNIGMNFEESLFLENP